MIDRIAAAAAHADHLDYCVLRIYIHQFKHLYLLKKMRFHYSISLMCLLGEYNHQNPFSTA